MPIVAALTRGELAERAPTSTLVLPLGATEQHGGHLPVSVDTLLCEHIAVAAAGDGPFLVAPALPYGRSDHHLPFAGTLSLRSGTLLAVLGDLLRSVSEWGVRAVFAVNGHGGNDAPLRVALADAADALQLTVGGASYWTIAWDALRDAGASELGAVPGHAGAFETSLLLAAAPDLVRDSDRAGPAPAAAAEDPAARVVRVRRGEWTAGPGTSDDASTADAEAGSRLLACVVHEVSAALADFHGRAHAR